MTAGARSVRTLAVWCPDWPAVAAVRAGIADALEPVAVVRANRVIAGSPAARAAGVVRGMRRRDAQSRCPQLTVVAHDEGRDAVEFEAVVAVVEDLAAGVMVLRPGACAVAARGPVGYHGGETAVAELLIERIGADTGVEVQIGVADGTFAALLAARVDRLIEPGGTPAFLADVPLSVLDRPPLVDLLKRLGIHTLGAFAALPGSDVLARFGLDAALAHRLAAGRDDRPLEVRTAPVELSVRESYDEPLDRVDVAAFAARALAVRLHERMTGYGLACTRLEIGAVTTDGQELSRVWRHDGLLDAQSIADRTRWQLDGWLTRRRLAAAINTLVLTPHGVVRQAGLQAGLWGEPGADRDRAHRALHRVQGLLGPNAVVVGVRSGGRDPEQLVTAVPFGDERVPRRPVGPYPAVLPAPYPALTAAEPVRLLDDAGALVAVGARLGMSGTPAVLEVGARRYRVERWWGPWPLIDRWWDAEHAHRGVRLQVVLGDGTALLLALAGGQWQVTGRFD